MFARWCARCLDFVIPFGCAACDAPVRSSVVWCDTCASGLVPAAGSMSRPIGSVVVISAHAYVGPVQHAIHRFKFSGRADLASRLARDVAAALKPCALASDTLVVPVPLSQQRLVERGYNQSALLAGCIARQLELTHRPRGLMRLHDGRHQVGANKAERAEQVSDAFQAGSRSIDQKDVILVDDVMTTGATVNACLRALTAAGARVVLVATVARVL